MPAQALIRKLTRAQIDKAISEANAKAAVSVKEEAGALLVFATSSYPVDPVAVLTIQNIADADAVLANEEYQKLKAAERS